MNRNIFGFNLLMAFTILSISAFSQVQGDTTDTKTIIILQEFYKRYIPLAAAEPTKENIKKLELAKKEYCTTELLKRIENQILNQEIDYDPFLKAQDSNVDWLATLYISKDSINPNRFIVTYIDGYDKRKVVIILDVSKQKEGLKIESVR